MKRKAVCLAVLLGCCLAACDADTPAITTAAETTELSPDTVLTGMPTEDFDLSIAHKIFMSEGYLVLGETNSDFGVYYTNDFGVTYTQIALELPDALSYDKVTAVHAGDGAGSGEAEFILQLKSDETTTYVAFDNYSYASSDDWLDFTCRGVLTKEDCEMYAKISDVFRDALYADNQESHTSSTSETKQNAFDTEPQIKSEYPGYAVGYYNPTAGYIELNANEVTAEQFVQLTHIYPVFVDLYPVDHGGPLFEIGWEYRQESLENIRTFMSIWQGDDHTVSVDKIEEELQRSFYQYNDISIGGDPECVSVSLKNIDVSSAQKVLDNEIVIAMIEYCGITDPQVHFEATPTTSGDGMIYTCSIIQDHGDVYTNSIEDNFVCVTVEGRGENGSEYVSVFGCKKERSEVKDGYSTISTEAILADLNAKYEQEITALKYEIIYSSVDFFGYSIPCYKIYVPIEGTDNYDTHFYRMCLMDSHHIDAVQKSN